jgi:DNA-directed RNA polymerase subunit beta
MKKPKFRSFAKAKDNFELPSLLDIQVKAYEDFLQRAISLDKRTDTGLEEVFREVFPLESYDGQIKLEYVSYYLGKEKYSSLRMPASQHDVFSAVQS